MVADDKVILFGPHANHNATLSSSAQKAIKDCRETLSTILPKSFAFFDGLDDALFDLADKAESNQKQEEYFTAMRQIRLVQGDIKKKFTQNIVTDFDNFWKKPTAKNYPRLETNKDRSLEINDTELCLLQNADLEEEIAIRRISGRSQSVCGNEIGKLTTRFAHMLSIESEVKLDNPLDSVNVINHLKEVISPLPINISIKLVIYKQYEKQAVNNLFQLYQTLNKQLTDNGILPKIPYKIHPEKTVEDRNAHNQQNSNHENSNSSLDQVIAHHISHSEYGGTTPYAQSHSSHDDDLFNSLRQLLTGGSSSKRTSPAATSEEQLTSIADHRTLLSALSSIQQQQSGINISEQGDIDLPAVRSTLLQTLNANGNANEISQTISPLDNDTLDIIDLLFEFILEDKNIPLPMRGLLARLQIPMLKIAIADKGFFHHKNHPARRLLNNLAQAATGWTQTKNYEQEPLYKHIDNIVTNLVSNFKTDIQIFEQINEELNDFAARQQHSSQAIEKLTAETSQGQERVELAQHHVDKIIHGLYVEASPVPKVIVSLIEDGWKQSLRLRLIQKGEESEEWQTSISLIKQLLKSVKRTESEEERQQRLELIPGLHKEVQSYLQSTPITPNTLTVLLKALQRCHIKILNGDEILENEQKRFSADTAPEPRKTQDPIKRIELEMYSSVTAIDNVKKLKIGTWVDIQELDKEPRRIKFSWRSNLTKKCLFVTSKGIKAAEWTEQELAVMFEKGEASILDQSKPLMDRALVSMMETVNKVN
ncbi:MAG: hypothetical protein ACI9QV_000978 [Methylophagaceae bacterium]|jgi:hypothetical protein